jgi:hypothetical protein
MMKVTMLPIMPFKICIFTPRIIAFNETFSCIGKEGQSAAVVWDESIAGRNSEDVASAYLKFFRVNRDAEEFTIFLDNCSAQNKNCQLFSFFLRCVHQKEFAMKQITLKYFEPGHSFMSADSEHAAAEKALRKKGTVLDLVDFAACCSTSKSTSVMMKIEDFLQPKYKPGYKLDMVSQHKLGKLTDRPLLAQVVVAQFRRGSSDFFFKSSFGMTNFKSFNVVSSSSDKLSEDMVFKTTPRGVNPKKKSMIVKNLIPLMPPHRRPVWTNLPECASSTDLINSRV